MRTPLKLILAAALLYGPVWAQSSRPFWTEQSSYLQGDRVYFVGVASKALSIEKGRQKSLEAARAALSRDETDPMAHVVICRINYVRGDFPASVDAGRKAVALNPNLAIAHFYLGEALAVLGQREDGLCEIDEAIRLSPNDPYLWVFEGQKSRILLAMGDYDEALR